MHLRRTVPPPRNVTPRGGILKGGPNNYRVISQRAAQPQSHSSRKISQQKHTMRDLEEDSSSLSDGENGNRPQSAPSHRANVPYSQQPSIETLSLQAPSHSSQASDLYDFVGLSQQQSESKRGATPEERLHNLLGELKRGDRSMVIKSCMTF